MESRLHTAEERLEDDFRRTLRLAERELHRNDSGLRQGLRKHLQLYETRFHGLDDRIRRSVRKRLSGEQSKLEYHAVRLQERIGRVLTAKNQRLGQALFVLSRGATTRLTAVNKDIDHAMKRLRQVPRLVDQRLARLDERQRYLEAVSPERMFARGYSLTRDAQGNIVRDAAKLEPGQIIHTQLARGTLTSTVEEKTQDPQKWFILDCRGERTRFDYEKRHDPEQHILGPKQRQWLMDRLRKSEAEFVFLVSTVPWFLPHTAAHVGGSDRPKGDTFVGFLHERKLLTDFFDQLDKPVLILTGDLHTSAAIRVTDNVWEILCAPLNSTGHPRATPGNPPMGGRYDSGGRKVLIKWLAGFPNNVPYARIRNTVYGVIQVNNIAKAGTPSGTGYQWTAFDEPQIVVRWHDGHTGRLLYAEGISSAESKTEPHSAAGANKKRT